MAKYTSKVRRGLDRMRMLLIAAQDEQQPPIRTIMDRWTASQSDDYNAAMEWLHGQLGDVGTVAAKQAEARRLAALGRDGAAAGPNL